MFAYCGNNPVVRSDSDGDAWETVWDLVSLGLSIADVINNPDDFWAWAGLIGDLVDVAIPFVGGLGEATRAINVASDVVDAADDYYDAGKIADNIDEVADNYQVVLEGACFVEGTMVLGEAGYIAIEDVTSNNWVWAWDEETGDVALKEVVETYVNETFELVHIFVDGEEIITTPTHPFYSPVKGWTEAVRLRAGDILVLVNGEYVVVEKVQHEILEAPVTVYNFQVADYHTYYVSQASILVHNSCSQTPTLPKNGTTLESSDALSLAENYLGPDYHEASPGRFVSFDGTRQVRLLENDLLGTHAGGPHINFDRLVPSYKSVHVYFID